MDVRTRISTHPKMFLLAPFESGSGRMRIKVEVNTFERSPARDLIRLGYDVDSDWFSGQAQVQTYQIAELVASKLRALYQRSKGRDLFDLWLAVTRLRCAASGTNRLLRRLPALRAHARPCDPEPPSEGGERRLHRRSQRAP